MGNVSTYDWDCGHGEGLQRTPRSLYLIRRFNGIVALDSQLVVRHFQSTCRTLQVYLIATVNL